jgi:hypothetical protein
MLSQSPEPPVGQNETWSRRATGSRGQSATEWPCGSSVDLTVSDLSW